METRRNILKWLLEYACRYKFHGIISAIVKQSCNVDELDLPKVYLVTSALHSIITSGDVDKYPVAIQYLKCLFENCQSFIPFKTFSRLTTGVKMMVLMKMLESREDGVLSKLNEYFPRTGEDYPDVEKKDLKRLSSVYSNFRKFYLTLLADDKVCKDYFRDEYQDEYGPAFQEALVKLMKTLLSKIESHFPITILDKFMTFSEEQCYKLHENMMCASIDKFLDLMIGKSKLNESDLTEMLTLLGNNTECERVQPFLHNWSCTSPQRSSGEIINSGSKSLFSSSSDGGKNKNGKSSLQTYNLRIRHCEEQSTSHSEEVCDSIKTYRQPVKACKYSDDSHSDVNMCYTVLVRSQTNVQTCELSSDCLTGSRGEDNSYSVNCRNKCHLTNNHKSHSDTKCSMKTKLIPSDSDDISVSKHRHHVDNKILRTSTRLREKLASVSSSSKVKGEKKRSKLIDSLPNVVDRDAFVADYVDKINSNVHPGINHVTVDKTVTQPDRLYDVCAWSVEEEARSSVDHELAVTGSSEDDLELLSPRELQEDYKGYGTPEGIEILTLESSLPSKSHSDIDLINSNSDASVDDEDLVPTSDLEEFDLDEIYHMNLERLPPAKRNQLTIPEISHHARHPDVRLCIIKIYRNKKMDISERGQFYAMYS